MDIFPGLLYIFPILGFLIFVHELGHFATAKAYGILVHEFGFGFPPRIFGIRRGETIYSINLIPLGGFVKMQGEEDPDHPRSLAGKPLSTRFLVIAAGPLMNLLAPVLMFAVLFAIVAPTTVVGNVQITEVLTDSPAAQAGLRADDYLLEIQGEEITTAQQVVDQIQGNLGEQIEWVIRRDTVGEGTVADPEFSTTETIHLVPRVNPPIDEGHTGIKIITFGTTVKGSRPPIWKVIPLGIEHMGELMALLWDEVYGWVRGTSSPELSGPIGIAQVTGEISRFGATPLVNLAAIISINLAIVNFLPIPALDGGRLLFLVIEWVRRGKRISPQREGLVHLVGFVALISFIVIISYFDVMRLIRGENFIP